MLTKTTMRTNLIAGMLCCVGIYSFALQSVAELPDKAEKLDKLESSEEYQIGIMVKAIDAAIHTPERPGAQEIIVKYGTDSRYYVMIRGWLVQELKGVDSQLLARRGDSVNSTLQLKADFLGGVIRRIDLE